jgi:hypothetical protein
MRRSLASALLFSLLLVACAPAVPSGDGSTSSGSVVTEIPSGAFGGGVTYEPLSVTFNPAITAEFSVGEAKNVADMEKAYGFTLTPAEKSFLSQNKFLMKNLLDTSIRPYTSDYGREFVDLYKIVAGDTDYKNRAPQNAVFYSTDVFLHLYPVILTELLKEMENEEFAPAMLRVSTQFYTAADKKAKAASGTEKTKWTKIRNYFAVPYAILSNAKGAPQMEDYQSPDGAMRDPSQVLGDFAKTDATIDTVGTATAFVKNLKLDAESETAVLADVGSIFKAEGKGVPAVFKEEYEKYGEETNIKFSLDWTQFTPRSHYTGSSLRRQYFRAMTWFIQPPFFLKSPQLTDYAFGVTQLMSEDAKALADYSRMEKAINFVVGGSDDLMPADYLAALNAAKGKDDQEAAMMEYLLKARPPRIKSIPANYPTVGEVDTDDMIQLTKGMRFFSGKFIIDSYWTQMLTQGDEAPRPGYTQKLPPMASSLEVMALLGSDYAKENIPTLDFYVNRPGNAKAVDQMMKQLAAENAALSDEYWRESLYSSSLWTIRGLFDWFQRHKTQLPKFMQSPLWEAKTLQTASGFWTEMRHATLLYAKQSFAEAGGGPGACDDRQVPKPPMGYVEPNVDTYDRLAYLARRTHAGLTEQKFDLKNMNALENYVTALTLARDISAKELADGVLQEKVADETVTDNEGNPCVMHNIQGESEVEQLRRLVDKLSAALPVPLDGPVLTAKDKRTSLIADVHTGGDTLDPLRVLYQGIGVPHVIIALVKDVNGPRATVGFAYSHYEFTEPYGSKRLTDEDWQKKFYVPTDDLYNPYEYTPRASWPAQPSWYDALVKVK